MYYQTAVIMPGTTGPLTFSLGGFTSAFCPAADIIIADIKSAVEDVESVNMCEVITTFDPPFGPEMMSEEARLALGI